MKDKLVIRPIDILIQLDDIDDWEYPNQEMELFQYELVYQTLEEYNKLNKVLNDKKAK